MKVIGLVCPITIRRPHGQMVPHLVAGAHRLAAAKKLGWDEIPCVVAPPEDDDRAALMEIDENLVRGELSPAERAAHIARRKEIYERLHPGTVHGGAPGAGRGKGKAKKEANLASFQNDTARKTGRSQRDIRRDAHRGENIPKIVEVIGTSLDKGEELDALAKLPPERQERVIARAKAGGKVSVKTEVKQARREEREKELAAKTEAASRALGRKVYGVIYADPPWRFEPYSRETGMDRAADNHYRTEALEAICRIEPPAAENCVLFLWATAPMLREALTAMEAWGFDYRTHCVWNKDREGTGYWFRNRHELLLVGIKGKIPAPAPGTQFPSVIEARVGEHSEKPECFAEMIEEMFPSVRPLEMFARKERLRWDVWGNEVPVSAAAQADAARAPHSRVEGQRPSASVWPNEGPL